MIFQPEFDRKPTRRALIMGKRHDMINCAILLKPEKSTMIRVRRSLFSSYSQFIVSLTYTAAVETKSKDRLSI